MALQANIAPNGQLINRLWQTNSPASTYLKWVVLAFLGAALITVCAKIKVPFIPVPMTMTTFAILAVGAAYGSRLGLATVGLYLAQGAMGFPVFAGTPEKGIGLAYMMGTTGGYLVGYLIAAAFVGFMVERGWGRSFLRLAPVMIMGGLVLYAPGLLWLGYVWGWENPILQAGMIPFIPGDIAKALLAAAVITLASKALPSNN